MAICDSIWLSPSILTKFYAFEKFEIWGWFMVYNRRIIVYFCFKRATQKMGPKCSKSNLARGKGKGKF